MKKAAHSIPHPKPPETTQTTPITTINRNGPLLRSIESVFIAPLDNLQEPANRIQPSIEKNHIKHKIPILVPWLPEELQSIKAAGGCNKIISI